MDTNDVRHMTVSLHLKEIRRARKMTQAEVVRQMQVFFPTWAPNTVWMIEAGRRRLLFTEAVVLAEVLDCALDELANGLPEEGEAEPPFASWLLKQVDRDDPVGDLARDARVGHPGRLTPNQMRKLTDWAPALESIDRAEAEWADLT